MWDDEASLDYRQALTLEMKRQQIQRELQQMEEEEQEAREQAELILQKEVSASVVDIETSWSLSPSELAVVSVSDHISLVIKCIILMVLFIIFHSLNITYCTHSGLS